MLAINMHLGIPVAEIAAMAGIEPDGQYRGDECDPCASPAATAFRSLVGCRPWPGLTPDRSTWATWPDPLRRAWLALRGADGPFAAANPRSQLPSFAVWRLVIEGDKPGWARPDGDKNLAALERQALAAGLDALVARLVPKAPVAVSPALEPILAPVVVEFAPEPELDPEPEPVAAEPPPVEPEPAPTPPPVTAPAPPAPRPPQAKGKRGRPAKESALSLRVRAAMEARGISSVADLEHRAGLTVDGFRDILRGKVGRNRAVKLQAVERVAAILRIPVAELAQLAGLVEIERKTDRGTAEIQLRREALAAGGDARVCWSVLGVLLAHGEVEGRLGITQAMHDTGRKFADLIARSLPGAPKMPRSELERFAYPGGRREADIEGMELRNDAARLAWQALVAADREIKRGIKPSLIVWDIAVRDRLPRWAEPAAFGPWSVAALAEWEALKFGLKALRHHFGQDAGHRAIVTALIHRDEARR